jgi:hypothetical protein
MQTLSFDIGLKSLAFAIIDNDAKEIRRWEIVDISCEKYDINEIFKNLMSIVDRIDIKNMSVIFIENQPSLINPKMKTIQVFIHAFFFIKIQKHKSSCIIKLVSPSSKLKFIKKAFPQWEKHVKKSSVSYTMNKRLSEYACTTLLSKKTFDDNQINAWYNKNNISFYTNVFMRAKKKDDLSDSLIYCVIPFF